MDSAPDSLRRRTVGALVWSGLGNYGAAAVHLVAILALGWLLPPTAFGLLALAVVFVAFAEGLGELGLAWALVQEKELSRRDLDSSFWCSLLFNLLLAGATALAAEPITSFLGDPQAAPLLRLLSLVFVIHALTTVPRALLWRDIDFRRVSLAQLYGEFAFAGAGLTMAALGFGFWSLGGAILAQRATSCVALWTAAGWRPGSRIDLAALGRLLRYGGQVMAGNLVERLLVNIDYFVIGRFIGTQALGYYSLAFQLAIIPLERFVGSAQRVAFPAFSVVQEDRERLRQGLLEGLRHLCVAVLPVAMCIAVLGPWLLRGIYGDKWELSVWPLRLLALAGLFFVPKLFEAALLAIGRPSLRLWLLVLRLVVFAGAVATFGLRHGVVGVALCVGLALAAWGGANLAIAMRVLAIGARDVAASLWPATRAGVAALSPLLLFLFVPLADLSPWTALVYSGLTMLSVYLALVLPGYRKAWSRRQRT